MATISLAELERLLTLARELTRQLEALRATEQAEQRAAARLGQPAGRLARIP